MAIQADGAIVIAGSPAVAGNVFDDDLGDFLVARFGPTGIQDGGFGAGAVNGAPTTTL